MRTAKGCFGTLNSIPQKRSTPVKAERQTPTSGYSWTQGKVVSKLTMTTPKRNQRLLGLSNDQDTPTGIRKVRVASGPPLVTADSHQNGRLVKEMTTGTAGPALSGKTTKRAALPKLLDSQPMAEALERMGTLVHEVVKPLRSDLFGAWCSGVELVLTNVDIDCQHGLKTLVRKFSTQLSDSTSDATLEKALKSVCRAYLDLYVKSAEYHQERSNYKRLQRVGGVEVDHWYTSREFLRPGRGADPELFVSPAMDRFLENRLRGQFKADGYVEECDDSTTPKLRDLAPELLDSYLDSAEAKVALYVMNLVTWLRIQGHRFGNETLEDFRWDQVSSTDWILIVIRKAFLDYVSGLFEKRMKYMFALVQAVHLDMKGVLPPRPKFVPDTDHHFLGGAAYLWFEHGCKGMKPRATLKQRDDALELLNSVTGIKKNAAPLTNYELRQSELEWYRELMGVADRLAMDAKIVRHKKAERLEALMKEVDEADRARLIERVSALKQHADDLPRRQDLMTPEITSACRHVIDALVDDPIFAKSLRSHSNQPIPVPPIAARAQEVLGVTDSKVLLGPTAKVSLGGALGVITREAISRTDLDRTRFVQRLGQFKHLNGTSVDVSLPVDLATISTFVDSLEENEFRAVAQALGEPFKVRMISKAGAIGYWVTTCIQKATHGALQKYPCFRLTKEDPEWGLPEVLSQCLPQADPLKGFRDDPEGRFFVSGDYTASTNNLNPKISELIADAVCRVAGWSLRIRDLYVASLTRHLGQTWGQFMGSPTSFPVLNLANCAGRIVAHFGVAGVMERSADEIRRFARSNRIGAFNGDDIGFVCDEDEFRRWHTVLTSVGLSPSPGKNFTSLYFIQLNSKMLRPCDPHDHRLSSELLGFKTDRPEFDIPIIYQLVNNASLAVLCPPRSISVGEVALSLAGWQKAILSNYEGERRDYLNGLVIESYSAHLKQLVPGIINWFIPRHLGGLGLEWTREGYPQASEGQLHAAAYLMCNTTVESIDLARMTWEQPHKLSNARDLSDKVRDALASAGLIEKVICSDMIDSDFSLHGLESALMASGQIQPVLLDLTPDGVIASRTTVSWRPVGDLEAVDASISGVYAVNPTVQSGERTDPHTGMTEHVSLEREVYYQKEVETSDTLVREKKWLGRTLRMLKSAARMMKDGTTIEKVMAHKQPNVRWVLKPEYTYKPSTPITLKMVGPTFGSAASGNMVGLTAPSLVPTGEIVCVAGTGLTLKVRAPLLTIEDVAGREKILRPGLTLFPALTPPDVIPVRAVRRKVTWLPRSQKLPLSVEKESGKRRPHTSESEPE